MLNIELAVDTFLRFFIKKFSRSGFETNFTIIK